MNIIYKINNYMNVKINFKKKKLIFKIIFNVLFLYQFLEI